MIKVLFRFYEELNDYLCEDVRKKNLSLVLEDQAAVGGVLTALGIPAAEVDLVLVNGESVGLEHLLKDGDRVSVYPIFERFDISGLTRVRPQPLAKQRLKRK